jgi:hypothetical protein
MLLDYSDSGRLPEFGAMANGPAGGSADRPGKSWLQ